MIGPCYVRELAANKLGKAGAAEWERTPNAELVQPFSHRDDAEPDTPEHLLNSGCPACVDRVYELVEAM